MNKSTLFTEYCAEHKINPIKNNHLFQKKASFKTIRVKNYVTNLKINSDISYTSYSESFSEFCNDGQFKIIKDLRNNKYRILATLDLHNHTQTEAVKRLDQFIDNHTTVGNTCLKVIHGKGLNSNENKPVLKHTVRRILEHHPLLLAYSGGNSNQGGDGITLVKFKHK